LIGVHALEFEASFVVASADYLVYLDAQQAVLLGVIQALEAKAIRLAMPPMLR
jgi:hypothetical protein